LLPGTAVAKEKRRCDTEVYELERWSSERTKRKGAGEREKKQHPKKARKKRQTTEQPFIEMYNRPTASQSTPEV
jgi:hypothetical protein